VPAIVPSPALATVTLFGAPIKWVVLPLLVLQNSATSMLVHQSRQPSVGVSDPLYLGSMAVLASELLKLPICLALIARDEGGFRGMLRAVRQAIFERWRDTAQLGVLALCYLLQNRLLFVALSRISATGHQLWSQSKTLFTALFFVCILGRSIAPVQWAALLLLMVGVGVVQVGDLAHGAAAGMSGGSVAASSLLGVGAVLASSLLSGFANIHLEKMLKRSEREAEPEGCQAPGAVRRPPSVWMRNVQLGLFSIPSAAALLLADRAQLSRLGLLHGFTPLVWLVVFSTAGGGLLVASVVKHADNILKTFAQASSILLTCLVTSVLTRSMPSVRFLQGMGLVITSLLLYNLGPNWGRRVGRDEAQAGK
jgi:UDP-sugar transporter A1/2/3